MKQYNNEKGIISLTTWTARINTVYKTINNLYEMCPNFHIVLVLAEEEFPDKVIPQNLVDIQDKFEILWVKKNWKAFKKVVFTLRKYKGIPVISADDDCLYTKNYAEELYQEWTKTHHHIIRYTFTNRLTVVGPCTLYWDIDFPIHFLNKDDIAASRDDDFYAMRAKEKKIKIHCLDNKKLPLIFHDDIEPLTKNQRKNTYYRNNFTD